MKKRIYTFVVLIIIGVFPAILNFSAFRGLWTILIFFILPLATPPILYLMFGSRGLLYGSIISLVVFFYFLPFSIPIFIISYVIYISAGIGFALYDAIQNQLNKSKTIQSDLDPNKGMGIKDLP